MDLLADELHRLSAIAAPSSLNRHAADLADQAHELADSAAGVLIAAEPARAELVARRRQRPDLRLPPHAPVHLYGAAAIEQVLDHWRQQLRATLDALIGFARGDLAVCGQWFQDWIEGAPPRFTFHRLEHIRDYLLEVVKLSHLLAAPPRVVHLSASEMSGGGLDRQDWEGFGGGMTIDGRCVALEGSGITAWHRLVVPAGGLVRIHFTPQPTAGDQGGAMLAFPAAALTDRGFAASHGPMEHYNHGIDTYHVSLSRGRSGVTNLRRTGRGLRMLSTVPDPCHQRGRAYLVEMLVHEGVVQVFVDGVLQHHYVDAGAHGPPLSTGRFGARLFAGPAMRLDLADLSIHRIAEREHP